MRGRGNFLTNLPISDFFVAEFHWLMKIHLAAKSSIGGWYFVHFKPKQELLTLSVNLFLLLVLILFNAKDKVSQKNIEGKF